METMLEAANLTKRYEDFSLSGVSLEVGCGAIAGIYGANGAGKSTLLKVLACQAPAHSGQPRVLGRSYACAEPGPSSVAVPRSSGSARRHGRPVPSWSRWPYLRSTD